MTSEQLSAVAGLLLSLVFSYVPKVKDWFEQLDSTSKRSVMAVGLIAIALGAFAISCGGVQIEGVSVQCSQNGVTTLILNLVAALVANQATFLITPKRTVEDVIANGSTQES